MSMSLQTSNSGAFRSLHCLIYKVLAPLRARCGTLAILPQVPEFVKYFFDFFQNLFSYLLSSRSRFRSFAILPHSFELVKHFFQLFQSFSSAGFVRQVFFRKLSYYSTLAFLCQAFFSISRELFCQPSGISRPCQTACLI